MLIKIEEPQIDFQNEEFKLFFLENCLVVPFDIFWIKKSGEKTKVVSQGSVLSKAEIDRWTKKEIKLEIEALTRGELMSEGISLLMELEHISLNQFTCTTELPTWRKKFNSWIYKDSEPKLSIFELSCLFAFLFNELSEEIKVAFHEFPEKLQAKNLAAGGVGVSLAILAGYLDLKFLKELYTTLLFMDYPFSQKTWSDQDLKELEVLFLKEESYIVPSRILDIYKGHIESGISLLKNEFSVKALANYLRWSFESFNGRGLLKNINASELSDLDSIVIYCHSLFRFEALETNNENSFEKILKNISRKNYGNYKRLERLINNHVCEEKQDDESDYLEIVGL